ncbi:MAG TPA: hypothetical protein VGK73_35200, partial [Polyangiaceae bacterium]
LGSVRERAVLPGHSIARWVDFAGSAGDVELGVNESRRLEPGSYGHVVVPAGATLRLGSGRYRFASLAVARTGALAVEASAVTLHVAEALVHQGVTRVADSAAAFVLGYFGTAPATIDASFTGTVVAPNAELVLGAVRNASYRGAFFARVLEVRPTSSVEYADQ